MFYARPTGLEGQVSKLTSFVKNFLPELACRKATWLRLFKSDTGKAVCLLRPRKIKTHLSVVFTYARPTGLEPATSRVTGECSNQLSYGRIMLMAGIKSIILDFRFRTQAKQFACVPPPCVGGRNRSQVLFRKPATPPHCRQWRHVPAFDSSRKQSSLLARFHLVSAGGIEPATLGL